MITNTSTVVACWRHRVYNVCSSDKLKSSMVGLEKWLHARNDRHLNQRKKDLEKLRDRDNLFKHVADTMILFFEKKHNIFKHALECKKHFWRIPWWKRAIVFLFLLREILNRHASRHWHKWTSEDYEFTVMTLMRYKKVDKVLYNNSELYRQLPDDVDLTTPVKRKREVTAKRYFPTESSMEEPTAKTSYVIVLDDTSDDDA